jgi:hypothetical protein
MDVCTTDVLPAAVRAAGDGRIRFWEALRRASRSATFVHVMLCVYKRLGFGRSILDACVFAALLAPDD